MPLIITLAVLAAALAALFKWGVTRVTVYEYEKGLRYDKGEFAGVVEPGQYWFIPVFTTIRKVDTRPRFVTIPGQEVLSNDGVTLKVSLAANYQVTDPETAVNKNADYADALYLQLQLALRQIISAADIDAVLAGREEFSTRLMQTCEPKAQELGLQLIEVSVKDIMFPGKLKEVFAQIVNARKQGQAALERARGETAALRNLANAAKMIDTNPNLLQLRAIQALDESSGNTIVLGVPPGTATIPTAAPHTDQPR